MTDPHIMAMSVEPRLFAVCVDTTLLLSGLMTQVEAFRTTHTPLWHLASTYLQLFWGSPLHDVPSVTTQVLLRSLHMLLHCLLWSHGLPWCTQLPLPSQVSLPLQYRPSSHDTPEGVMQLLVSSTQVLLHSEPLEHGSPKCWQTPEEHTSLPLHHKLSSQDVPLFAAVWTQLLLMQLSIVHGLLSSQLVGHCAVIPHIKARITARTKNRLPIISSREILFCNTVLL